MVTGYEVSEDGTLQEVEITKDDLDSTRVICVVDDATKSIYLWKGSQAGIRKKFVGARVATNLRTEYGFHFKVRPIDEGEEPPTFFSALDGSTAATRVLKPGAPAPPPKAPTRPETAAKAPAKEAPPPPKPPKETPPPAPPKTKTAAATATRPPPPPKTKAASTAAPRAPSAAPSAAAGVAMVTEDEIMEMIRELEQTDPPEGYRRELLIVYNQLFTVTERRTSIFGQEKIERRFERVKDPPEGTFMAEGFIPRVIVKDGKVLGIELLKGTPDAILSPIKAEMKERLSDLISFFKSELEEEAPPKAKSTKRKRKLVAK
ncbi:MAG: hypothetical protein DRO73_03805 [Candidatus Thorarchaeota archaeon]|nr:MAG: hypothetical protein DRO73_03805 [Candidatus Thorarchaeota archaeon]